MGVNRDSEFTESAIMLCWWWGWDYYTSRRDEE